MYIDTCTYTQTHGYIDTDKHTDRQTVTNRHTYICTLTDIHIQTHRYRCTNIVMYKWLHVHCTCTCTFWNFSNESKVFSRSCLCSAGRATSDSNVSGVYKSYV